MLIFDQISLINDPCETSVGGKIVKIDENGQKRSYQSKEVGYVFIKHRFRLLIGPKIRKKILINDGMKI